MQTSTARHYAEGVSKLAVSLSGPFPQSLGNHAEEGEENCRNQRLWKTPREHDPLNQLSTAYVRSKRLKWQTPGARVCTWSFVSILWLLDFCNKQFHYFRVLALFSSSQAICTASIYFRFLVVLLLSSKTVYHCNKYVEVSNTIASVNFSWS